MSDAVAERLYLRTMRRVIGAVAALALSGGLAAGLGAAGSGAVAAGAVAAQAASAPALAALRRFTSSLDDDQLAALGGPTGSGVRLADLSSDQRAAAMALVDSLLSPEARRLLAEAMAADDAFAASGGEGAGSGGYRVGYLATGGAEFLQFAGPHLAVNALVSGGAVTVEPELIPS